MKLDFHHLGMALLAFGMPLMQLANDKRAWWLGLVMMTVGPILASLKQTKGRK